MKDWLATKIALREEARQRPADLPTLRQLRERNQDRLRREREVEQQGQNVVPPPGQAPAK